MSAQPFLDRAAQAAAPPPPAPAAEKRPPRRHTIPLGLAEDVPELRRRPFICAYYRLEPPCSRHLWCCHNELGNIWTHILALAAVLLQLGAWLSTWLERTNWSQPLLFYRLGILAYFLGSLVTFFISVQYHWRMSSSDEDFLRWMCLDQSACLALVILGFFAGVPMGFHCFPKLQCFYMVLSVAVCLLMVVAIRRIPSDRWDVIAGVIIVGTGIGYVTPAIHWLIISERGREVAGSKFVTQLLLTAVAVVFYVKYVPERFAPGKFDLLGNSHQLWHVAIYLSIALYGEVCIRVNDLVEDGAFCI